MKKRKSKSVDQKGVVCCKMLRYYAFENEDHLITYSPAFREFLITIPKALGGGGILMGYCPWCGAKLPESLRKTWFRELRAQPGFKDAELCTEGIPVEFKTDQWWRGRKLVSRPKKHAPSNSRRPNATKRRSN